MAHRNLSNAGLTIISESSIWIRESYLGVSSLMFRFVEGWNVELCEGSIDGLCLISGVAGSLGILFRQVLDFRDSYNHIISGRIS